MVQLCRLVADIVWYLCSKTSVNLAYDLGGVLHTLKYSWVTSCHNLILYM